MADLKVWVCQVRHEARVGGESQRCRHTISPTESPSQTSGSAFSQLGCGEMELIGGEPIQWCATHDSIAADDLYCETAIYLMATRTLGPKDPCQFESQIRVSK